MSKKKSKRTRLGAKQVRASHSECKALIKLIRSGKTEQRLVIRARIILLAQKGYENSKIALGLGIHQNTVRKWKQRWMASEGKAESVVERLQDAPRSGAPSTFMPEQLTHLFAIACEHPEDSERPISQWTSRELNEAS